MAPQPRPRSSRSTVIGTVATLATFLVGLPAAWLAVRAVAPEPFQPPVPSAIDCPQYLGESHEILLKGEDSPPKNVAFAVTPSKAFDGRVSVTFSWLNEVGVYRAAVAISGVYGHPNPGDDFVVHAQPAATTGDCWNWYSYIPRKPAQPNSLNTVVDGLWANQEYCFYASYQKSEKSDWSQPSDIECFITTWKPKWGIPEYPG